MARYDYECEKCGAVEEHVHGMLEKPVVLCSKCQGNMNKKFVPSAGGFILKGYAPTKDWKETRYRRKRNEELKLKNMGNKGPKLRPNIAGLEQDSWSDAQKLAKEAGMNADSYQPLVDKEKKKLIV